MPFTLKNQEIRKIKGAYACTLTLTHTLRARQNGCSLLSGFQKIYIKKVRILNTYKNVFA